MKIRADVTLGEKEFALQMHSVLQETDDHLTLKLAAALFFAAWDPVVQTSAQHPSLQGQDFWPDLMALDLTGDVTLWIECDKTTLHKLSKVSKRHRQARLVILTAHKHEAVQMSESLEKEGLDRFDVWTFADGEFARWKNVVQERNDIIGETSETSLNLVINGQPFMTDLRVIRSGSKNLPFRKNPQPISHMLEF